MEHTPGPWQVERMEAYNQHNRLAVIGNGLALVTHTFDGEQAEANMQLIAAAPDLLAACEMAINEQSIGVFGAISNECITTLRLALAKARGEL